MWENSTLQMELILTILVLILKYTVGTRVIWLIKVLWNLLKAIIDTRVKMTIMFYDVLHGFFDCRITGVDIMELKMHQ